MDLSSQIESILFVSNKPLSAKSLAKAVDSNEESVKSALQDLKSQREHSGIVLLESNGGYQFATNRSNSEIVKSFLNADLREKLTEATVEVLAIIAYRQPISKAEIEAIRGVNSQYSIRALLMRGLIEKVSNPNDSRSNLYQITTDCLQHLGITHISELADFQKISDQIKLPDTPQAKPEPNQQHPSDDSEVSESETAEFSANVIEESTVSPEEEEEEEYDDDDDDDQEDDEDKEDEKNNLQNLKNY